MSGEDYFERLSDLHQWLDATTGSNPEGAESYARRLSDYIHWLDETMPGLAEGSLEHVYSLHLRAACLSRRLRTHASDFERRVDADLAIADSLLAVELAREAALLGDSRMRDVVIDCLGRLLVVAAEVDLLPEDLLRRIEKATAACIDLARTDDGSVVAIAARMSSACSRFVLACDGDSHATAGLAAAAELSTQWLGRASTLSAEAARPATAETTAQLALAAVQSFSGSMRTVAHPAEELRKSFALALECWRVLEQAREVAERDFPEIPPTDWATLDAWMRQELIAAIDAARKEILSAADDESSAAAGLILIRPLLHALPEALWPRSGSAREVLQRLRPGSTAATLLQDDLDRLEVGVLKSMWVALSLAPFDIGFADIDEAAVEGLDEESFAAASGMAVSLLLQLDPAPLPAYLACALTNLEDEAALDRLPELENELGSATAGLVQDSDLEQALRDILRFRWRLPNADDAEIVEAVAAMFSKPISSEQSADGLDMSTAVLRMRADSLIHAIAWLEPSNHAALESLLALSRSAEKRASDASLKFAYALAQADLLYVLAQTDLSRFPELVAKAREVVDAFESGAESAFARPEALVRCYRYIGVGLAVLQRDLRETTAALAGPNGLGLDEVIARLRDLASDGRLAPEDRQFAAQSADEIALLADNHKGQPSSVSFTSELLELRPSNYLGSIVRGEPGAEFDRQRVDSAWEAMLRQVRLAGRLGPHQRTLEYFAGPTSVSALQLSPEQRIELARLALEIHDPTSVESSQRALSVAKSIASLAGDPEFEVEVQPLLERYAERYLGTAVSDGLGTVDVIQFMLSRVAAALNFGAVCTSEFDHRTGVAVAAHLLAVAHGEPTLAAWSAYYVEEMARNYGSSAVAERWADVYRSWRECGGMNEPVFAETIAAISYDLEALNARRSSSDG